MRWRDYAGAAALLLAACGSAQNSSKTADMATFDVIEPPAEPPRVAQGPQIAYSHTVSYAFDRPTVGAVQGQQLALCRTLGTARCVVVKSSLTTPGPGDHVVTDEAVLLIDARQAEAINRRLDAIATAGGATVASRQVDAEDVTRQVIDVDASVRAKQALADRLLAIIRSGKGNVGELVQAERAYATTQQELDAARGQRADLARRVAMSALTIRYAFDDTPGRDSPIVASVAGAGETLSDSVATLLTVVIAALPWVVVGGVLLLLLRHVRRKRGWRWPRRPTTVVPAGQ